MSGPSMRAAVTDGHGGLEMVDLPRPEPGPADLLIRVDRAGICGSDLHALTQWSVRVRPCVRSVAVRTAGSPST
jgi:threonine dehydrogenase-like Zn-dependent dehydrogenase